MNDKRGTRMTKFLLGPMRVALMLAAVLLVAAPALAACAPDALGTARVMTVSTGGEARFGTKSYPATLPLGPKEVVLTFDDGPLPGPTDRVLEALARECVRATFFLIGRNAAASPHLVRRIASEGHTLANHSMTHPWTMRSMSHAGAWQNIIDGQSAIEAAAQRRIAPFFRFPGFADTPALLVALKDAGRIVFGTDVWASDWNPMSPETQLDLLMGRLKKSGGGIVLLHDTKNQTAAMVPAMLRALKAGSYRVVHIISD